MKNERIIAKSMTYFLIFAMALSIFPLSLINVANGANYNNYARISVEPNPCGVGQSALVVAWLIQPTPMATAGFVTQNWNGFMVKITSPTGNVQTFGPYSSDATGGVSFYFVPNEIGNYTLLFTFPGQTIGNDFYNPQNATTTLTAQQEPIAGYPMQPLPTGYWSAPIYAENRDWYKMSGNWLQTFYNNSVKFNPYTTAPTTAHIVWGKQQYMGGIVGGANELTSEGNAMNFYQGPIYQNYFTPPLIMNGRLYYMVKATAGNVFTGLACVDLITGNQLWLQPASVVGNSASLYGQILNAYGANGQSSEAFIWQTGTYPWTVLDANTGSVLYTVTNMLNATGGVSGPQWLDGGQDPFGSIIAYYVNGGANWLLKWNSTQMLMNYSGTPTGINLYAPPVGRTLDWNLGIQWNVTIPHLNGVQTFGLSGSPGSNNGVFYSDGTVLFTTTATINQDVNNFTVAGYSCQTGGLLWSSDFADIAIPGGNNYEFFGPVYNGIMTVYIRQLNQWYGFNELTGKQIWGPVTLPDAWDLWTSSTAAYGELFCATYGGNVYCIGLTNGSLLWTYHAPSSGFTTPYGDYPLLGGITVADGKLYIATGEHTPNNPYWLGAAMYCVNASTGEEIYHMSGWWNTSPFIAYGYLVSENCYNGVIYSFGKGQTDTTVTAPNTQITLGQDFVIRGTVMDASTGLMDMAGNHLWKAASTPAIADPYMTPWMAYLYEQKPQPTNATGVPVTLSVVDANGNYRTIGTTTSDITGTYSFIWKPDIPGKYVLTATFGGSESYFGSSAETVFYVASESSTIAPTSMPLNGLATESTIAYAAIAIIVVIVIIGSVLGLIMLRKRQ